MTKLLIIGLSLLIQNVVNIGCLLYLSEEFSLRSLLPPSRKLLLSFIIINPLTLLIQLFDNNYVLLGVCLLLLLYTGFLYINTTRSFSQCFTISGFGYLLANIPQIPVILACSLLHITHSPATYNPVTCTIILIGAIITFLILRLFPIRRLMQVLEKTSYYSSLIIIIAFLFLNLSVVLYNKTLKSGLLLSTFTTTAIFILLGIFFLYKGFQDRQQQKILHDYEVYLPILDQMIQNIQRTQHAYNNQISTVIHLTELYKDYNSLSDALNEFTSAANETLDETYDFLHLENKLLASLLYCKTLEAKSSHKELIIDVTDYSFESSCSPMELVDFTGILIDNALEATAPEHTIYVTVGSQTVNRENAKFKLSVQNPGPVASEQFIQNIFTPRFTTKKMQEGHGLGLSILKSQINRHKGRITISNTYPQGKDGIQYLNMEIEV